MKMTRFDICQGVDGGRKSQQDFERWVTLGSKRTMRPEQGDRQGGKEGPEVLVRTKRQKERKGIVIREGSFKEVELEQEWLRFLRTWY